MLYPTLYAGYFFGINKYTQIFYTILIAFSVINSHIYLFFGLFIFLLDIPITYGILGVLMKNEKTHPYIYSILGKEDAHFFLG